RVELRIDLSYSADYGDVVGIQLPRPTLTTGRNTVKMVMDLPDGRRITEDVKFDVPRSLAGAQVQLEIGAGDAARLDAAPPVDLPSLLAAFRKLLPGNVWAVTIYPADEGIALDGKLVKDLPLSAENKLRPQTNSVRASAYKTILRTVSPAKRVVNGTSSMRVRVRAK